jgi:hypothetical protein
LLTAPPWKLGRSQEWAWHEVHSALFDEVFLSSRLTPAQVRITRHRTAGTDLSGIHMGQFEGVPRYPEPLIVQRCIARLLERQDSRSRVIRLYRFGWPFRWAEYTLEVARGAESHYSIDGNCMRLDKPTSPPFRLSLGWPPPSSVDVVSFIKSWITILGSSMVAWTAIVLVRKHHRRHRNRCVTCGYSMAGLVTTCCPECGRGLRHTVPRGGCDGDTESTGVG